MPEMWDITQKDLAPAVTEIARGRWRKAVPVIMGVVSAAVGGPIVGAAVKGGAQFFSMLVASSADKRMQEEGARLDNEEKRAELIADHLRRAVETLRRGDDIQLQRLVGELSEEGSAYFRVLIRIAAGLDEKLATLSQTSHRIGGEHRQLIAPSNGTADAEVFQLLRLVARGTDVDLYKLAGRRLMYNESDAIARTLGRDPKVATFFVERLVRLESEVLRFNVLDVITELHAHAYHGAMLEISSNDMNRELKTILARTNPTDFQTLEVLGFFAAIFGDVEPYERYIRDAPKGSIQASWFGPRYFGNNLKTMDHELTDCLTLPRYRYALLHHAYLRQTFFGDDLEETLEPHNLGLPSSLTRFVARKRVNPRHRR